MDDITVITEDASELLCDVCPTVSASSACCRRFHGFPVVLFGVHGFGGVRGRVSMISPHAEPVALSPDAATRPFSQPDTRPDIVVSREANANKGR